MKIKTQIKAGATVAMKFAEAIVSGGQGGSSGAGGRTTSTTGSSSVSTGASS